MAGGKEMACCVRGHHVYKDMWTAAIGEGLVCHCWCVVVRKLLSRKIFSYVSVNIFKMKKKKANYGTLFPRAQDDICIRMEETSS